MTYIHKREALSTASTASAAVLPLSRQMPDAGRVFGYHSGSPSQTGLVGPILTRRMPS